MPSQSVRKQRRRKRQAEPSGTVNNNGSNKSSGHLSFKNHRSFAATTTLNNKNSSEGSLNSSQLLQPGAPSDDDLYDAGWAKHWDPTRRAFYYYPIDGSAPTSWENPLLTGEQHAALAQQHHASLLQQSFTLSQLAAGGSQHSKKKNPVAAVPRASSNNASGMSKLTVGSSRSSRSSDNNSESSFEENEASFFGESGASLSLAALMAGGNNTDATNINNASGHFPQNNSHSQNRSMFLDASQTIQEDETFHNEQEEDYFSEEEEEEVEESLATEESSRWGPTEAFEDEPTQRQQHARRWTDRKPLRMPKPKPTTPFVTKQVDTDLPEDTKALVAKRKQDYLNLFDDDAQRFEHKPMGLLAGLLLCLLILTGLGVGGYFLIKSFQDGNWNSSSDSSNNSPSSAPTAAPLVLPDYTQAALNNPVSEQAVALNWLYEDPNYHSYSTDEKLTRFALMAIYTSTGGSSWGRTDGFVLPESAYAMESECEFPYYSCPGVSNGGFGTVAPVTEFTNPPQATTTTPPATNSTPPPAAIASPPAISTFPPTNSNTNTSIVEPAVTNDATSSSEASSDNTSNNNNLRSRQLYDGSYAKGTTLNLTNQGILQGTLPPEIALLTELQHFHVSQNPGLIGSIPESIRSWEDFLFSLVLTFCSISGTIPTIVGQLRHVRTVHLNDNSMSGTIPASLSLLSQLTSLQIQNNQFTGILPNSLAAYPYIHQVNMANNKITGPLPTFYHPLALASQVKEIILNNNSFSGTIPSELGGLTQLEVLRLHSNPNLAARSSVPNEICQLMTNHKLRVLSVDCLNILCPCPQCECPTGGTPRVGDVISFLPDYTISDITASGSATRTPQAAAYNWLQEDPAVDSYSIDEQKQRFALATLYYATSQAPDYQSWDSFLNWVRYDKGGECNWQHTQPVLFRIPDASTDGLPVCFETTAEGGGGGGVYDAYQSLRLANNSLVGTLPPEIALLSNLKMLQLHGNTLAGSIPIYLNALTALNVLDMEDTSLTGTLPTQLMELPLLNKLYLAANALNGTLPTQLGLMTTLETLQLSSNMFIGTLPTEISQLSNNLKRLFLTSNQIGGRLPTPGLRQLTFMEDLYLDNNQLMGTLEDLPLTTAPNLVHLVVSKNRMNGTMPSIIGSMPSVRVLQLDNNQFEGPIPSEIFSGLANTLQWLHLSSNLLTSTIPTAIGLMTQLTEFHAANNRVQGTIPTEIAFCRELQSLSLETNRMSSTLPSELGSMQSLSKLKIDHNNFRGLVPIELGLLSNSLTWLDLSWNALTGNIPMELSLLANLEWIYLERNNLDGPIPTELGLLPNLRELSIYGMQLTGTIPSELGLLSNSVTGIFLHENYLEGTIPSELGLLTQLTSVWLHVLALTGTVPAEVCNLLQNGKLQTFAIDCTKVTCTCGCSCPTEGGDTPQGAVAEAVALVGDSVFVDPVLAAGQAPAALP